MCDSDKTVIEMPFSEEVTDALFDCCGDKPPEPDGMTMTFLQGNWDAVNGDVMRMFTEFFSSGKFIGLIPKKAIPQTPRKRDPHWEVLLLLLYS